MLKLNESAVHHEAPLVPIRPMYYALRPRALWVNLGVLTSSELPLRPFINKSLSLLPRAMLFVGEYS